MKPIIGILPLWDEEKESLWMYPGYIDGIHQAGGMPIIFPFTNDEDEIRQLVKLCDGFVFPGGQDISPEIYHEEAKSYLGERCLKRDFIEKICLEEAIKNNKPALGICRGLQFFNASLGGSLYQDINVEHPTNINHRQPAPYSKPIHEVSILKDSPLYKCLDGIERIKVNSCHHQAIKDLAPSLKAMAIVDDGILEAIYMPSHKFLWAVQWHPEMLIKNDDVHSIKLFKAFIDAAKN